MKKLLLIVTAIFFLSWNAADAQIFAKFYMGYSLPLSGMNYLEPRSSVYSSLIYPMDNYERVESDAKDEQQFVSLGKGMNIKGAVGMKLTDNISAEVDFGFLLGSDFAALQNTKYTVLSVLVNKNEMYTYKADMLQVIPMLMLDADAEIAQVFVKFGPVFNMGVVSGVYFSVINGQTTEQDVKFKGGMSLGMSSALGAQMPLNDKLKLFAEVQFMSLSYSPGKAKIIKYEVNGVDHLNDLATEDKEFVFKKKISEDVSADHPDNQPTELLKIRFPLSNIGLHAGVQLSF